MAAPIYKQFILPRTVFCLLLLAFLACFPQVGAAQSNPVYTVEGVEVDVTDKNAVAAREKAMDEAQVKAYQILAERLLGPEQLKNFVVPDPLTVSSVVQDIEVTNEQLSRVRYKGVFTVRFRPNAIKSQMAAQGRSYSDAIQKPILVLPFFQTVGRMLLWDSTNPWMNAWRTLPTDKSMLQPTVLPLGDANDVSAIGDDDLMNYDAMRVQQLAARYGADDVALLYAADERGSNGRRFVVTIYKHGFDGPQQVQKLTFDRVQGETESALMARAAAKVKSVLRSDWKSNAVYSPNQPAATQSQQPPLAPIVPSTRQAQGPSETFATYARFASVQEWVRLKSAIDRTPGVQSVLVKALKSREAMLDIRFAGNINQLQSSLQGAGILMRATGVNAPIEIYMNKATPQPYNYR